MSKVMGKTYFNHSWLINKEYSAWIKNVATMNFLSIETVVANIIHALEYG